MAVPLNRREFLGVGAIGAGLLWLSRGVAAAPPASANIQNRTVGNLIYIFGDGGGPDRLDFNDPKLDPSKVDTLFKPIATTARDLQLTEIFPSLAQVMHLVTTFRCRYCESEVVTHFDAARMLLQRNEQDQSNLLTRNAQAAGTASVFLDNPNSYDEEETNYPELVLSSHLGLAPQWLKEHDTYATIVQVLEPETLAPRGELRRNLQSANPRSISTRKTQQMEELRERALTFIHKTRSILRKLPQADIERYNGPGTPHPDAIGMLHARELMRRRITNTVFVRTGGGVLGNDRVAWDYHRKAEERLKNLAPPFDRALAELLKDSATEDLLPDDTLIVFDMELGRTSKIDSNKGRGHARLHSAMIRRKGVVSEGNVIGSSGKSGNDDQDIVTDTQMAKIIEAAVRGDRDPAVRSELPDGIFT